MDREGAGEHGLLGDGSGPEGACAGQVCPAPSGMGLSGGSSGEQGHLLSGGAHFHSPSPERAAGF